MSSQDMKLVGGDEVVEESTPGAILSRRALLQTMAGGAVAAAAIAGGVALPAQPAFARDMSDVDILNFALNLEYLEAEFYTYAISGQGIESVGIGTDGKGRSGPTSGGRKANITDPILMDVAKELAFDEQQHVRFLRSVLGKNAIAKPAIKLDALGMGFDSDAEYLIMSRAMEDTGTSAYVGAAPMIQSKAILGAAARILADEAYHMGNIRLMIAQKGVRVPRLDGVDIPPPPTGRRYFAADNFGLTPPRTIDQVKAIARPFFPMGMNAATG